MDRSIGYAWGNFRCHEVFDGERCYFEVYDENTDRYLGNVYGFSLDKEDEDGYSDDELGDIICRELGI